MASACADRRNYFIPCKITKKKYVDQLLDGGVFMRPLSHFGIWEKPSKEVADFAHRDLREGALGSYTDPEANSFLSGFEPAFKEAIKDATIIDCGELQCFKVFCLYCLEVDMENGAYIKPDDRIRGLGDTVVVFRDFNEFLRRLCRKISSDYIEDGKRDVVFLADRINYYDHSENRRLTPLFEKERGQYSYQNELRIAFIETEYNQFSRDPQKRFRALLNKTEMTLEVGPLRDIAYAVSLDDFLQLKGLEDGHLLPHSTDPDQPSIWDLIVRDTGTILKDYRPDAYKFMATI